VDGSRKATLQPSEFESAPEPSSLRTLFRTDELELGIYQLCGRGSKVSKPVAPPKTHRSRKSGRSVQQFSCFERAVSDHPLLLLARVAVCAARPESTSHWTMPIPGSRPLGRISRQVGLVPCTWIPNGDCEVPGCGNPIKRTVLIPAYQRIHEV